MSMVRVETVEGDRRILERPRLVAQIGTTSKVCIVRAPQGFGKTVALQQWAQAATERVLWVEPAASRSAHAEWIVVAYPWDQTVAGKLVAESDVPVHIESQLANTPDIVIVIDGLHRMRDKTTHESLASILQRYPQSRMVAAARSRSPLQTLIVDLDTVTVDDLALTSDDVMALAQLYGVVLAESDTEALADTFGGWPAMVDKVLRHLSRRPATPERVHDTIMAADASFASWLTDGVIDPGLAEMMVRLSLAETLTVASARFLTGDDHVVESLNQLVDQGLLGRSIDLDTHEPVYEFPSVIRRIALTGMGRTPDQRGDERSAALASWWRDQDRPEMALRQAYAGKDWLFIADLFESHWSQLVNLSEELLVSAMRQMPADVAQAFPKTHAVRHLILGAAVSPEDLPQPAVRSFLDIVDLARKTNPVQAAERAVADFIVLRRSGRYEDAVRVGRVSHYLSLIVGARVPEYMRPFVPMSRLQLALTYELAGRGKDAAEQLTLALTALERAPEVNAFEQNQITGVIAVKAAIEGDVRSAQVWLARQVEVDGSLPRMWLMPHVPSAAQIARAVIAVDTLNKDAADGELNLLRLLQTRDELWAMSAWAQARHDLLWSDRAGAFQHLDLSRMRYQEWLNPESAAESLLLAAEVDLLLAAGEGTRAAALLTKSSSTHPMVQLSRARLDWLTGKGSIALRRTRDIIRARNVTDRVRLEALILRATLLTEAGDPDRARSLWAEACTMAERMGGSVLPFLLTHTHARDLHADSLPDLGRLVERIRRSGIPEIFPPNVEVITLTERELAVLERIAENTPVATIARLHYVSEATVKSQMRSLYAKLGAHSREEAVNAAQAAGLIDP